MAKREEGFTLLEMIISIGAIALVSGFILQMFLVSERVNRRASDTDEATAMVVNAVETIKRLDVLEDYQEQFFFRESATENNGTQIKIIKCYDKDWSETEVASDEEEYRLTVTVDCTMPLVEDAWQSFSADGKVTGQTGMLAGIRAEVSEKRANGRLLADISTNKYFDQWVMQ